MEPRVAQLAKVAAEAGNILVRIETRLGAIATKADFVALQADIHEEFRAQTKRIIMWMAAISAAIVGLTFLTARYIA